MQKTCAQCSASFDVTNSDQEYYEQIHVPAPRTCSMCRLERRLIERNARKLYKRKCDLTGKEFISPYHPRHQFPVYEPDAWWSDDWDPMEYGKEFDFNRPFFEQSRFSCALIM